MPGFSRVNEEENSIRNEMVRVRNRDCIYCDYIEHAQRSLLNNTLLLKEVTVDPYLRKEKNKTRLIQTQ